ncbi:S8 family serine peptidase [Nonomuraea sp. NPDC049152]|uniref:S8 family serine peptidase n=1 Tax=Nonomuraea sp. NPDC049152 TaxID=3154350 RepID=UPI0033CF4AB6
MRVAGISAGVLLCASALVVGPSGHASTADAHAEQRAITLITGDTVRLGGGVHTIERGPGREGVTFLIDEAGGRLRVVPSDAAPLLREGRLDTRLFDVSALLESGYDREPELPLIIVQDADARARTTMSGSRVVRDLPSIDGTAVRAQAKQRTGFWKDLTLAGGVRKVWLDGRLKPSLETSVPQVGVLDSGVDAGHPDLAGRIAGERNFTDAPEGGDDHGHGTHVPATIVSGGGASAGRHRGVAPGAQVLAAKVCADFCQESAIIAGMHWSAEQGAKVVNMSLTGDDHPGLDPLEQAVEQLTAQYGTLFVVAAGNNGKGTVGSPATADAALAVGAVARDETLAAFSSTGPRTGDHGLKPDITAPGVDIVAARSRLAPVGEGSYISMSGTSMATPHVAGAAAILAGQHPGWTPSSRPR